MWMCRELGVPCEHVEIHFGDGSAKTDDYLAINPNGKIPAIDDDGFRLWESMAINIYLAKKYDSPLMPKHPKGEALVLQWSFWVMAEVEKPLLSILLQRLQVPADSPTGGNTRERSPKNQEAESMSVAALERPLAVLNEHLGGRDYLLGESFTVADLNVASVLAWAIVSKLDLSAVPNVQTWLGRCMARPAARG
jgi:glutathione S-transferase